MSRSTTYEALGRGDLRAIKLGAKTLVDVEAGLVWLGSMPAARITTGRRRNRRRGLTAPVEPSFEEDAAPSAEELVRLDEILAPYGLR
jgi:hypothetical protein